MFSYVFVFGCCVFGLISIRTSQDGLAPETVDWMPEASLLFHKERPVFIGFGFVAGDVFVPEFHRSFGVLDDQPAIHDRPQQWIGRAHLADADGIATETTVGRSIFRRILLKGLPVL